jgi:subtilisin family serine protease
MIADSPLRRLVALLVGGGLILSTGGPVFAAAADRPFERPKAAPFVAMPIPLPLSVLPASLPSVAPAPMSRADVAVGAFARDVAAPLALPHADVPTALSRTYDAGIVRAGVESEVAATASQGAPALEPSAASARHTSETPPPRRERQERSGRFALGLSAFSALGWATLKAAHWGVFAGGVHAAAASTAANVLGLALTGALAIPSVFAAYALVEVVLFTLAVRKGRGTTDAQFRAFITSEVMAGRLPANAAFLLKAYRPSGRFTDLTFGFAAGGSIWMRPELIASPTLFRIVFTHELTHWLDAPTRGPPSSALARLFGFLRSETHARVAELKGVRFAPNRDVSDLERGLRQSRISLRLTKPYDVLVLNPGTAQLSDPKVYAALSGGAAKITTLAGVTPGEVLGRDSVKGYQLVVLGGPAGLLPAAQSKDSVKLELALRQLDSLYLLATNLTARAAPFEGSPQASGFADLAAKAERLRTAGSPPKAMAAFETDVRKFWREIAGTRLKGVSVSDLIDDLYGSLRDRGAAFLPFAPQDSGVSTWLRLLRYWESPDGGQLRVTRVDLENGGHILMLRKFEPRVGLWLRPIGAGSIATSVANADDTSETRAAARAALESAGYGDQLKKFDELGVLVRHVLGDDVGRQEFYITVPRRHAAAIRKVVLSRPDAEIGNSRTDFEPHLIESPALMAVPPVWKAGITGTDGKILWIDTGADATHSDFAGRLDVIDMVNEGSEDWLGHGTHVAGISIARGLIFKGMASNAIGTMAKVFSREGQGAADGEIMGSAAIAMQKGYDVVSLSLGSQGSSADNLAVFFSELTHRKNSAGEFPIITASAGNSGPFDQRISQPSAGVDVISVAAATKEDRSEAAPHQPDGQPGIAFYSSPGPDKDRRYFLPRWRMKPDLTAIGGDVVTLAKSAAVYLFGVFSMKSKDAPPSASDHADGLHTGMSGTSMSNPAVAGIALLVKLALKAARAFVLFIADHLPFAVKAILMRSASDMQVPIWFQGAGLVDAWGAVQLTGRTAAGVMAKSLGRLRPGVAAPASDGDRWDWIKRLQAVVSAEERVFHEIETPRELSVDSSLTQVGGSLHAHSEDEAPHEEVDAPTPNADSAAAARAEAIKRFGAVRDAELPGLITALVDPVWLVRQRAALALMNLRSPLAATALMDAALSDSDGRVRQTAFLAVAELQTKSVDERLKAAVADARWDVGVFAAYALARHGDRSGAARFAAETGNGDKRARFTAVWLAGQLGASATAAEAEALGRRVADKTERDNIRHLATAALANLADAAPESLSDAVVTDVLSAAGSNNLALTRTISKFFPAAVAHRPFVVRLRAEPLKTVVADFVLRNRSALQKPGALAELVQLLAKAANIPLDSPTAVPDASGKGVAGVDPLLGPLDFLLALPHGASSAYVDEARPDALLTAFGAAGLGAEDLSRFEATPRAVLPHSGALWVSVPEHKRYAFSLAMGSRGFGVRLALPENDLSKGRLEGPGATLELGGSSEPATPADVNAGLVRVRAAGGVSEARVMAAMEAIVARAAKDKPLVIALSLGGPAARGSMLTRLVDALASAGVGVVVAAGNSGPGLVSSPADTSKAAVVAAVSEDGGLQFYSSRGAGITWADVVEHLEHGTAPSATSAPLGTGIAAERSAERLARMAKAMADAYGARGRKIPAGWFGYLRGIVARTAAPVVGAAGHEVGSGRFDEARALELLRLELTDLDAVDRAATAGL